MPGSPPSRYRDSSVSHMCVDLGGSPRLGGRVVSRKRWKEGARAREGESVHEFPPLVLFQKCIPHLREVQGPSPVPPFPVPTLSTRGGPALAETAVTRSWRPASRPRRPGSKPRSPGPRPRCRLRGPSVWRRRLSTALGSMVASQLQARFLSVALCGAWINPSRRCDPADAPGARHVGAPVPGRRGCRAGAAKGCQHGRAPPAFSGNEPRPGHKIGPGAAPGVLDASEHCGALVRRP